MRAAYALSALVAFFGGCVSSSSVTCGDTICPADTICSPVTDPDQMICATADQLKACTGSHDHAKCQTDSIPTGRCYDGVCLETGCGNGRVDAPDPADPTDHGEVCDDSNQASGDGCSADCLSTETCGNGIVDAAEHEQCDDGNLVDHDGCDSACEIEVPAWEQISFAGPSKRSDAAMVWDAARDQIVMFGGQDNTTSAVLGDTWLWDGLGWRQVIPPGSPKPRLGARMAYDSDRHRVVLFGGWAAQSLIYNDTWEWDGTTWIPITTETAPGPRWDFSMVYDGQRHHITIYGGRKSFFAPFDYTDTWTWDGTSWSPLVTAHTPSTAAGAAAGDGRFGAATAYDPTRGVTVLFSGSSAKSAGVNAIQPITCDNHVWELDGTDWHEIIPASGPVARSYATLAYDAVIHKVMLLAGQNASLTNISDQWEWNGTAWALFTPTSPPNARDEQAMAGDATRGVVVMFGGETTDGSTWEWNGAKWTQSFANTPSSEIPTVTYDSARGRLVDIDADGFTFELGDAGWSVVTTNGPTLLALDTSGAFTYDPLHAVSMFVGGNPMVTWLWNGSAWTTPTVATEPTPREGFTTALDHLGHIVLFGGDIATTSVLADTWTWDGTTWRSATPAHSPSARTAYGLAYDPIRGVTVLFGGIDGSNNRLADTWTWDGTDWTQMTTMVAPTPRANTPLVWELDRRRIALVGGDDVPGLADTWEWDGAAWTQLAVPSQPFSRTSPLVFSDRVDGLVMLGGVSFNDAWSLRWQGPHTSDTCSPAFDLDGDGLTGCADPDCWATCTPDCSPGMTGPTCTTPACGDGTCGAVESCRSCPADCGACAPICGDGICDPGETCPGDCP